MEQDSGLVVIVTPHVQLFLWVKVPRETPAGGRGAPPHHTATFTACGAGLSGLHSYSLHPTISKPDYDAPPQEHGRAQEMCCPFILIVRSDKQNTQTYYTEVNFVRVKCENVNEMSNNGLRLATQL